MKLQESLCPAASPWFYAEFIYDKTSVDSGIVSLKLIFVPHLWAHENAQRAHSPQACWSVAEIPLIRAAGLALGRELGQNGERITITNFLTFGRFPVSLSVLRSRLLRRMDRSIVEIPPSGGGAAGISNS